MAPHPVLVLVAVSTVVPALNLDNLRIDRSGGVRSKFWFLRGGRRKGRREDAAFEKEFLREMSQRVDGPGVYLPKTDPMTVFVRHVNPNVSEVELGEHMSATGEVYSVDFIPRPGEDKNTAGEESTGNEESADSAPTGGGRKKAPALKMAFVKYMDSWEAERAIISLDNSTLAGQTIRVHKDREFPKFHERELRYIELLARRSGERRRPHQASAAGREWDGATARGGKPLDEAQKFLERPASSSSGPNVAFEGLMRDGTDGIDRDSESEEAVRFTNKLNETLALRGGNSVVPGVRLVALHPVRMHVDNTQRERNSKSDTRQCPRPGRWRQQLSGEAGEGKGGRGNAEHRADRFGTRFRIAGLRGGSETDVPRVPGLQPSQPNIEAPQIIDDMEAKRRFGQDLLDAEKRLDEKMSIGESCNEREIKEADDKWLREQQRLRDMKDGMPVLRSMWRKSIREYNHAREAERKHQGDNAKTKTDTRSLDYSKWDGSLSVSVSPIETEEEFDKVQDPSEMRYDLTDPDPSDMEFVQGHWLAINTTQRYRPIIRGRFVTGMGSQNTALFTQKSTGKLWMRGLWLDRERSTSDMLRWKTGGRSRYFNLLGGTLWIRQKPPPAPPVNPEAGKGVPTPLLKPSQAKLFEEEVARAKEDGARVFRRVPGTSTFKFDSEDVDV